MYAREIGNEVHTFGVSGKLIMNGLVMYDHQTRTLWSQILGRAVRGDLMGVNLDLIPVTQTSFAYWVELHSDTLVLDKGGRGRPGSDPYASYYAGGSAGIIGETHRDPRLDRKEYILGVRVAGEAKAYPMRELASNPLLNDSVAGQNLLIYYEPKTATAIAYQRTVNGQTLTFRIQAGTEGTQTVLVDNETGSRWLAFTGMAIEGPLQGTVLERAPSHYAFWFGWTDYYPGTELYEDVGM